MGTKSRFKSIAIYVAGWAFILLGIAGLFLPILQGILFILIGLFILSSVAPWAERLLNRLRKRFPRISRQFDEAKARSKEVQTKIAAKFDDAKSKARKVHTRVLKRKRQPSED